MIKKRFRWQWSENIYKLLVRTAFVILGVIGAVQVALYGIGTRSTYTAKGLKGLAVSWLREMEEKGYTEQVKWFCVLLFAVVAVYALVWDIKTLLHIMPRRSRLGRSILKQASRGESFRELCRQIDYDMEAGYREFGTGVYISSSWVLEEEVMRLVRIKKITQLTGLGKTGLLLEDTDGNQMKLDLMFEEPTKEALAYLKSCLPLVEIAANEEAKEYEAGEEKRNMQMKHLMSWHVPKTQQEVNQYAQSAKEGDAAAQREYGKCLLFGKGIEPDAKEAYAWLEKAAAQADEIAKMYVGHCKLYGIGTAKAEEAGYELLDNALNYNYPEESSSQPLADYSQFEEEDLCQLFWDLGDALEKGLGPYINYNVAVYYFDMLNDWGHPEGAERKSHYKRIFWAGGRRLINEKQFSRRAELFDLNDDVLMEFNNYFDKENRDYNCFSLDDEEDVLTLQNFVEQIKQTDSYGTIYVCSYGYEITNSKGKKSTYADTLWIDTVLSISQIEEIIEGCNS